jgi:hypothetical protein
MMSLALRRRGSVGVVFCVLLLVFVLTGHRTAAQATSSVTGVVTDSTGAVVVGASVTLANSAIGFSAATKTNDSGAYEFVNVPPGEKYSLTFAKDGFQTFTVDKVSLAVGTKETRDARLAIGSTTQIVEVTATGEVTLDTSDAAIGATIDPQRVEDLPSLFRTNAVNLLALQPAVESTGSDAQNGAVAGSRADQSNITLDGLDINDQRFQPAFRTVGNAPIDSISEVSAVVLGNDASFGKSAGAQLEMVTKSGSNDFHGSASDFNRTTDLAANDYFNNLSGVPRPPLIRNQFGGDLGGPIMKNKLYFFFDYLGLRQTESQQIENVVPLDALRNGELNYINNGGAGNTNGCSAASTIASQPACISTLTSAQVLALDPLTAGPDMDLVSLLASRYPKSNTTAFGDGVNTGGFIFNSPIKRVDNTYVGRLDYNVTPNQRLFARATWDRSVDGNTNAGAFPGDPAPLKSEVDHSRSWVVGHTWTISPTMTNQANVGLTRQILDFPTNFEPTYPNNFFTTGGLTQPYVRFDGAQSANVPVPEVRDVFSWQRGNHTLQLGADLKPIRVNNSLENSAGFYQIGLGGQIQTLGPSVDPITMAPNALRPADIYGTGATLGAGDASQVDAEYDGLFPVLLGRYAQTLARYNYNAAGNPFPVGNFQTTGFHYSEFEFFGQDVWKIRSDLTLTYGLRWQYHQVPFEEHGIQANPSIYALPLLGDRIAAANNGINGNNAVPLVTYNLSGPVNHGSGYYSPEYTDFSPRLGLAYSPSFTNGFLGKLFGDRKSSIRAGAGINYDREQPTLSFEFSQQTFIFANEFTGNFGGTDPATALATSPRFQGFANGVPALVPPGTSTSSLTPNLDANGNPVGLVGNGATFFGLNNDLKTPYEISFNLGVQRQLPGDFFLDVEYVGKLGRRLFADGDAAQQINFKDPVPNGQTLYAAFGAVQKQLEQGVQPGSLTPQQWFEDEVNASPFIQSFGAGATCASITGLDCTNLSAAQISGPWTNGDVSTMDLVLAIDGLLQPNTGLLAQTGAAGYYGNFSSSSYNGLIVTLRKQLSHNLTFDFDYTFAHSIDNVSDVQNEANQFTGSGIALVCDLRDLHVCRGNSKFDARHTIAANFVYGLPFGRGQSLLGGAPRWLDEAIGGWKVSGDVIFHTGFPFTTSTGTFPIDFTQDAPPVFVGPSSAVSPNIHVVNGQVQFFSNPTNALGAFQFPFGGGTGNRNILYGPPFANVDMALLKDFPMPWSDRQKLQFRAEAFNVFNHPSFGDPNGAIENQSQFGQITSTISTARQLQLALKYSF